MGLLSNNDIYTADTNPTSDVNPKTIGAVWINTKTCTQFICKDNTKNKNIWGSSWDNIYPVGSLFITVSDIDPNVHFGGKWKLEGGNRALWSVSSGAGGYISSGLPNIVGGIQFAALTSNATGIFGITYNGIASGSGSYPTSYITIDGSRSNKIYGSSSIVQPPAFKVYVWIREA